MYVYYPTKGHKESNEKGKGGRKWEPVNAGNSRSDRLRLDWILDIHPRFIPRLKSYSPWSYYYDRLLPVCGSQRETRLGAVSRQLHSLDLGSVCKIHHPITTLSAREDPSETYRDGLRPAWFCAANRSQDASKLDPSYPRTPFPVVGDALDGPSKPGVIVKKHLIPFCPFFFY